MVGTKQNVSNSYFDGGDRVDPCGEGGFARTEDKIYMSATSKLVAALAREGKTFNAVTSYTNLYNLWSHGMYPDKNIFKSTEKTNIGSRVWVVLRRMEFVTTTGTVAFFGSAIETSLKRATEMASMRFLQKLLPVAVAQADSETPSETIQGEATQESVRSSNVIVTIDSSQEIVHPAEGGEPSLIPFLTTEPVHKFDSITSRWMPLKGLNVTTAQKYDTKIMEILLPKDLMEATYRTNKSANMIPFQSFVYGQYDIEMRFTVNANKFQAGRAVASIFYDPYLGQEVFPGVQAALMRPHIMIDYNSVNTPVLKIPFRYHRGFVRNAAHAKSNKGVQSGISASVQLHVLAPVATIAGSDNTVEIRPLFRFTRAEFAGMSYKAQMDVVGTVASGVIGSAVGNVVLPSLKTALRGVEKTLDQLGPSQNQDKPTVISSNVVIPRPRMNFACGTGDSDAVPLRMNPTALTSFSHVRRTEDDPITTIDIARIWGLQASQDWNTSDPEDHVLFNSPTDPSLRYYRAPYVGVPTPIEAISSIYQFWSGTIELRFDFVSTDYHSGSVAITVEYNRESDDSDRDGSGYCGYTKIFQLGKQKSVTITVPYIYDTPMRRNNGGALFLKDAVNNASKKADTAYMRAESHTFVKMRVLNKLRAGSTASSTVKILRFIRAGEDYHLHSLCPSSNQEVTVASNLTYFPVPGDLGRNPARAQMDNNEDTFDSTIDFKPGPSVRGVLTSDSQVNIKDILRRPTLLINQAFIKGDETGYFIPVMPPTRCMVGFSFSKTLILTPQATINNMFRFWRGSTRYTILSHTPNVPIFVSYLPHTGTVRIGRTIIAQSEVAEHPVWGSGLSTDMILPTINPSITVEVPFDTENLWTLMHNKLETNSTWRDKGDYNAGHLIIAAPEDVKVSVWWSAGDDFELSSFVGTVKVANNSILRSMSDAGPPNAQIDSQPVRVSVNPRSRSRNARTQMDDQGFSVSNVSTAVGSLANSFKRVVTTDRIVKTGLCMLPGVGGACTTVMALDALGSVQNTVTNSVKQIETKTTSTMESMAQAFDTSITKITDMVTATVGKILGGFANGVHLISVCVDVLLDVLIAWIDQSWTAIGVGIMRFLSKVVTKVSLDVLMGYAKQLGEVISSTFSPRPVAQGPSRSATIVGILAGVVGTMLGVKLHDYRYWSFGEGILERLTEAKGASYLIGVLRFVEAIFDTVKEIVMDALGIVSPEAAALKMLSAESPVLQRFITDAQIFTSEANGAMTMSPGFRTKFWHTVMQAYQVQSLIAANPQKHVSPILGRLCADVIRVGNEKFIDVSASPVRYEPFVLAIEGPPGIGKSHLVDQLITKLLDSIRFTRPASGASYTRLPGSKFWSGYRDQPVVVYDDWMNLTDPESIAQVLREFYQLKSTATFIPEMAHLEEKKIRGNPLIVIQCTNDAFPDNAVFQSVSSAEAVYRRRDALFRATLKPDYRGRNLRDLTPEDSRANVHLEFAKYQDPRRADSLLTKRQDYAVFEDYIVRTFQRYHAMEQRQVKERLRHMQVGIAAATPDQIRLEDPFALYYSITTEHANNPDSSQNAFLPSELLAMEVRRITAAIDAHQVMVPVEEIPEAPTDPFVPVSQGPRDLLTAVGVGVIGSIFSLEDIGRWTKEACVNVYNWLTRVRVDAECSVCLTTGNVALRCSGSQNVLHYVCEDCEQRGITAGAPIVGCPMCRAPQMVRVRDTESGIMVYMLGKLAAKVGATNDWIAEKLLIYCGKGLYGTLDLLGRIMLRWSVAKACNFSDEQIGVMNFAGTATDMGRALYERHRRIVATLPDNAEILANIEALSGSNYEDLSERERDIRVVSIANIQDYYSRTGIEPPPQAVRLLEELRRYSVNMARERLIMNPNLEQLRINRPPMAQLDEFGDMDYVEPERLPRLYECKLDSELVAELVTQTKESLICTHRHLMRELQNGGDVAFRDGKFLFMAEGTLGAESSDLPCQHTDCVFRDESTYSVAMNTFLDRKSADLTAKVALFVVQTHNREVLAGCIPRALQPRWMRSALTMTHQVDEILKKTWWEYLTETYGQYKILLYTLGAVTVAISGICVMRSLFSPSETAISQSVKSSADEQTYNVRRQHSEARRPRAAREGYFTQACHTPDIETVVKQYVARNYVSIRIVDNGVAKVLTAVGLCGHKAIMPRHYCKVIRKVAANNGPITIFPALLPHATQEYAYDEKDFKLSPYTDIALWELPPSFAMFKDIRKFIATDKIMADRLEPEGSIILAPTLRNPMLKDQSITLKGVEGSQTIEDVDGEVFTAYDVLGYSYSQAGACGSLVLMARSTQPIVAMHVAGYGDGARGHGYGVILTKEALGGLFEKEAVVAQMDDPDLNSIEEARIIFPEQVNVQYLGAIPKDQVSFLPKKTKIRPSVIQGKCGLKPQTFPCILDKTDPRYKWDQTPLVLGSMKHGLLTKDFPSSWVNEAKEALWDGWISKLAPAVIKPEKFSHEDACVGLPGVDYYDAMQLDTSAGFPWSATQKKRKEDYITFERDDNLQPIAATIDKSVLEVLAVKENLRKQGIVAFTPFIDTLKDERRKEEKLMKPGGTRVFCNPTLDHVISMRQHMLHFTAAFMKNRMDMQHAVGIDVSGLEWTGLARRLISISPKNIVTIDYSNFGPAFNAVIADAAADLMVRWTMENVKGVDELEVRALMRECTQSTHICHNTVYRQKCGSPSGSPITTIINSLVNLLLIAVAWKQLVGKSVSKSRGLLWEEYKQHVCVYVYGDDLIMSVSDAYIELFNGKTITDFFREYNIVATDASKGDEIKDKVPLEEAEFLKRKFLTHEVHQGVYQSALAWASINDTTQWIWEGPNHNEATRENCRAALLSAHGHGQKKFDVFKKLVNTALIQAGVDPIPISWGEIDALFYPEYY